MTDDAHAVVDDSAYVDGVVKLNMSVPSSARVYDYLLGGKDNFGVDREAAEQQAAAFGGLEAARMGVQGNRRYLGRVVRYLAGVAGIRQFLDIGSGIPTMDNVHEVAQKVAPASRVVYVDKDEVVLAHSHELLRSTLEGATAFIIGDLYQAHEILRKAADTIDFTQPVAVVLNAILHHVPDDEDAVSIVAQLLDAMQPGSYLAISHLASDIEPDRMAALTQAVPEKAAYAIVPRSHTQVSRLFKGLDLIAPGVVPIDQWLPDDLPGPQESIPSPAHHYGGIGRKR